MRWVAFAVLLLGGCASRPTPAPVPGPPEQTAPSPPPPAPPAPEQQKPARLPHYRCDGGVDFDVQAGDDAVTLLFAAREPEKLLRDAGGVTPQQTVYSSTKLKAQFGLDPGGRGAQLNFADPPLQVHCSRQQQRQP